MTDLVLESESFSISTENCTFSSDPFLISRGDIAVLYGLSEERIQEFLYLIGGLINQRGVTKPAEPGKLVRERFFVPEEQLSVINLLGRPLYSYKSSDRAQHIGYIFENPELFIIGNTVIEEFKYSFAALARNAPSPHALERYDLFRKMDLRTESLSGGERHRLNCACVLELSHDLLIADFSNSNLDADFTENLIEWLQGLSVGKRCAVLLTGIPAEKLSNVSPKKYTIQNGHLQAKEPDPDLFPNEETQRLKLQELLRKRQVGSRNALKVEGIHLIGITIPVSFELKEGELLIIRGPNGCGKTTLGKILTSRIRKGVGGTFSPKTHKPVMSLQYPERFFVMNSILEELPREELLELCGLEQGRWGDHPRSLSRSQQKLLSVAMTLERSQGYAILDEPTSGMDYGAKRKFIELINKFEEKAIIVISHDGAVNFGDVTRQWDEISS